MRHLTGEEKFLNTQLKDVREGETEIEAERRDTSIRERKRQHRK